MRPTYKLKQKIKIEFEVVEVEEIKRYRKNKKTGKMKLVKIGYSYIFYPLNSEIFPDENREFRINEVLKGGEK